MSDLISRQAAIDAINSMFAPTPTQMDIKEDCLEIIENLPSAQPEIIYCKDCRKHNVHSGYKDDCCPLYEWRGVSYGHEHDHQYCCFAERKVDG